MTKSEDSGSPGWSAAYFMQTTEDVAKAVAAVATAAAALSFHDPSAVFSIKDGDSQFQKFQRQFTRGHRSVKEPSRLFESMVVLGLHPNTDIRALEQQILGRRSEGSGKWRSALVGQNHARVEPNLEPQVLFVYPPEKQLPLKSKDLLSFCFPGGLEVHAVERSPSMSELNEILLGQEHLKKSDQSFVFRLQVADDSTLYGCCMLVEEIVQKPSGLISMIVERERVCSSLSRHILTTRRCYCILTRLPFFELHFGILNSIFTEERLERLTKGMDMLELASPEDGAYEHTETSGLTTESPTSERLDDGFHLEHQSLETPFDLPGESHDSDIVSLKSLESAVDTERTESGVGVQISDDQNVSADEFRIKKQAVGKSLPEAIMPLLIFHHESSESSTSYQGSPSEDRYFRSDMDEADMEEASTSGRESFNDHNILEWAKANNHGSLQIICEYYRLCCPTRGTTLAFCPLEHLHPLEFHRPSETVLHVAGLTIDLKSCSSLEFVEARNAVLAEEEATALSVWTVACLCGLLRLEHVIICSISIDKTMPYHLILGK
ncbi:hypothetical protein IFM89_021639 [Coptis chinensis]|uniref:uDENN domain-containing protein n=1 Tax=Coptis chinensis TaxID=261450 RepID=A0A835M0G3_9MAGN|nr:hypothetical protein IFM89_021639 [Coptis chinensis]